MSKVAKSFICRGCLNPVTTAGSTSVDIGASAKLGMPSSSVGKVLGHHWLSRWLKVRRSRVHIQVKTRISGKFQELSEMRQL